MVHHDDTPVADGAVMSPHGFNVVAMRALLTPKRLQVGNSLGAVSQQLLHFLGHSFESIVFDVLDLAPFPFDCFQT